jgi:hypothetical protein
MRRSFDRATLAAFRGMASEEALTLLSISCRPDLSFRPMKQATTRRWHVLTTSGEFEILTTGTKWYDTRARTGGGGAIDLAMHLRQVSFVEAVKLLTGRRSAHG